MSHELEEFFAIIEKIASTLHRMPLFVASSQDIQKGDVFVAFEGEKTDGHNYVHEALSKGASLCLIHKNVEGPSHKLFKVFNTLEFIQNAASERLSLVNPFTIGVTGSCGKTTTKNFLHSLLSTHKKTFCTRGNFNSKVGIPLSVLSMPKDTEVAVIEMGMSQKGDIQALRSWIKLNMSVIVSIGLAHAENFPDKDIGIARAKAEIMEKVAVSIFNDQTASYSPFDQTNQSFVVSKRGISSRIEGVYFDIHDRTYGPFKVPFRAKHLLENLHLALAACFKMGLDLDSCACCIEQLRLESGRFEMVEHRGAILIDDSYNASPSSMKSALEYFSQQKAKRKILVLGAMRELGDISEKEHKALASLIDESVEHLFLIGEETKVLSQIIPDKSCCFDSIPELVQHLSQLISQDDLILIKGSHSTGLHTLVDRLKTCAT